MASLQAEIEKLVPLMVVETQKLYDEWEQEEDDSFGICDLMDAAISSVVAAHLDVEITEGGHDGDDHAWSIVYNDKEAVSINLPAHVYEIGGGYNWKKKPDVVIQADDFVIDKVDRHLVETTDWSKLTPVWKYVDRKKAGYIDDRGKFTIGNNHQEVALSLGMDYGGVDLLQKGIRVTISDKEMGFEFIKDTKKILNLMRFILDREPDEVFIDMHHDKSFTNFESFSSKNYHEAASWLREQRRKLLVETKDWAGSTSIWDYVGRKRSGFIDNKGRFFAGNGHVNLAYDLGMRLSDLVQKGIRIDISGKVMSFEFVKGLEKILMKFIKDAEPDEVYIDMHHDKDLTDFDSFETHNYREAIKWLRDRQVSAL